MRLIDADALYERTAEWEAWALAEVEKHDPREDREEWQKWTHILNERTAFKHDVADAPTIEARQVGEWIVEDEFIDCSVCRREKWSRIPYGDLVRRFRYCPNCGARMEGLDETD